MNDWYDYMISYEETHGEKYGIDCKGGLIEIWEIHTYEVVARFTAEQASIFFEGLINHGDTEKDTIMLAWNIDFLSNKLKANHIDWKPILSNMSSLELYCYLVQYAERYELIEPQAN